MGIGGIIHSSLRETGRIGLHSAKIAILLRIVIPSASLPLGGSGNIWLLSVHLGVIRLVVCHGDRLCMIATCWNECLVVQTYTTPPVQKKCNQEQYGDGGYRRADSNPRTKGKPVAASVGVPIGIAAVRVRHCPGAEAEEEDEGAKSVEHV